MTRDISFGSFNLYNLQLPGEPTRLNARQFTGETYRHRIEWTAGIVADMQADVIAFQELWSRQALVDVFEKANLAGLYELHFIADEWYDIAVAAAVKKPWKARSVTLHKKFPEKFALLKRGHGASGAAPERTDDDIDVHIDIFSRTVLQLAVGRDDAPDLPDIQVFCAHLKSKLATELDPPEAHDDALKPHRAALGAALSTIRRAAEGAALRMLLTGEMKGTDKPVVLIGDLNDGVHSNTLAILTEQPPYRRYYASRTGSQSDAGLYASSFLQALSDFQDVAYSHTYKGVREQLDHVLVSEQFYDYSKKHLWTFRDQRIWNDHIDEETATGPESRTSDHGVVRARFDWAGPTR